MDEWGNRLIEQAGPLGAALGVVILAAGAVLAKVKGWFGKSASSSNSAPQTETKSDANDEVMTALRAINQKLGSFDQRIHDVELDLQSRPTSADIHRVELAIAIMRTSVEHVGQKIDATGAAVTRIEDFLLSLSKRKN